MDHLNRSAIVIKGKQPFLDWIHSTNEPDDKSQFTLDEVNDEPTVYLIREFPDFDALDRYLKALKPKLFAAMLAGWNTDESKWPKRTPQLFDAWFEVEGMSMVVDLEPADIVGEPMDS